MQEARSTPIVETTLSELAFILFFVLLLFAMWKGVEHVEETETLNDELTKLREQTNILAPSLRSTILMK